MESILLDIHNISNQMSGSAPETPPPIVLTNDAWMAVLEHLSLTEKLKCRLVCRQWKEVVDKLFAGQHYLEIFAVSSTMAAAAAKATGITLTSAQNSGPLSRSLVKSMKQFSHSISSKLFAASNEQALVNLNGHRVVQPPPLPPPPPPVVQPDPMNDDFLIPLQALPFEPFDLIDYHDQQPPESYNLAHSMSDLNEYELLTSNHRDGLSLASSVYLSYWAYAFCSSSSMFSSYSYAHSSLLSHAYSHMFCDCYPRNRHKHSLFIDKSLVNDGRASFTSIATTFPNNTALVLRNLDQMTPTMLSTVLANCGQLLSLSFINCSGFLVDRHGADPKSRTSTTTTTSTMGTPKVNGLSTFELAPGECDLVSAFDN